MKRVVENKPIEEISVNDLLNGSKYFDTKILFAYKSEGKSGYCFLTKLESGRYGFVAMNYTNTNPRFVAPSMQESLKLAVKCRDVYAFNGVEELAYQINKPYQVC